MRNQGRTERLRTRQDLIQMLKEIDNKSYPAYKQLRGGYDMTCFALFIQHVQGDPFAAPSMVSVEVQGQRAAFPQELYDTPEKKVALEDCLLRIFSKEIKKYSFKAKGSGKSGLISVAGQGPEILKRTGCEIDKTGKVSIRMEIGFPANGRRIQSRELEKILTYFLPEAVSASLYYHQKNAGLFSRVANLAEDQTYIRKELDKRGLVAFVANGSILPRETGVSSRPMKDAVPFQSPASMEVTMELPHKGAVKGMGIPKGITMIVGGGFHGKSTLLKALEVGVYNHIAGDGREYVITDDSAVKLRAEDGRSIQKTDISMFINNLPNGKDTTCFSTADASGSTSQAANVVEAMEAGSRLYLMDEDTGATNFLIRDELMQKVVSDDMEPITPFSLRVRQIYENKGISTILVAGSSGSYFHQADYIIQMREYKPEDITDKAKEMAAKFPMAKENAGEFIAPDFSKPRIWLKRKGADERAKFKVTGRDSISIQKEIIDLRYVEQLVDSGQLAGLAHIVYHIREYCLPKNMNMTQAVDQIEDILKTDGFEKICSGNVPGNLVVPRRQEIFACLNRWR